MLICCSKSNNHKQSFPGNVFWPRLYLSISWQQQQLQRIIKPDNKYCPSRNIYSEGCIKEITGSQSVGPFSVCQVLQHQSSPWSSVWLPLFLPRCTAPGFPPLCWWCSTYLSLKHSCIYPSSSLPPQLLLTAVTFSPLISWKAVHEGCQSCMQL